MRKRYPIIIPVLLVAFLFAALLFGRNMMGNRAPYTNPNRINYRTNIKGIVPSPLPSPNIYGQQIRQRLPMQSPLPGLKQMGFDKQRADNINKKLKDMDGIGQVDTIINGNTALIGYKHDGKMADRRAVKDAITKKVRQLDNTVKDVVVSDSANFTGRIRTMVKNLNTNISNPNLSNDFQKLVRDIRSAASI